MPNRFRSLADLGWSLFARNNDDVPVDVSQWLVVWGEEDPSTFDAIQIRAAMEEINASHPATARIARDPNSDGLILLVDDKAEAALELATRINLDLRSGSPLNPDAVLEAITEVANDIWDQADLIERYQWLIATGLSLARAGERPCPKELHGPLGRDYVYGA